MLFKHPLFWKEWKTAKWWSALIGSMFVIMFLSVSNELSRSQEILLRHPEALGSTPYTLRQGGSVLEPIFLRIFDSSFSALAFFLVPVIIIMSMMLFQSDRKESVGMFISSLPFTKDEQFEIKWFAGVLAFTIPYVIATLFAVLMRQVNMGWITQYYSVVGYTKLLDYDNIWIILKILAQSYLFMLAFFSVLMLMQGLMANNIAASIIGAIVLAAPWFILEAGGMTLSRIFNNYKLRLYNIEWSNFYFFMAANRDRELDIIGSGQEAFYLNPMVSSGDYWMKITALLVITLTAVCSGIKAYEKNDMSRNGYLLMFPWVGKILVPGVTLCSGLLANNFMTQMVRNKSVPYEIATLVIGSLIGYLIITKIIRVSEKHGS